MLEAMIDLGGVLLKDIDIIRTKLKKIPLETRQKNKRHIIKMNFDLQNESITFDIEEIDNDTIEKYLFLGHEGGKSQLQWYQTSDRCNNLITHSLPIFLNKLENSELKYLIEQVLKTFFIDQGENIDTRYRYILNIDRFFTLPRSLEDIKTEITKDEKKRQKFYKSLIADVSKEVTKHCADQFEIKTDQIGLFTVCINDQAIVQTQTYRNVLEKSIEQTEDKNNKSDLYCSVCGSNDNCTSKIDFPIKFYTTNLCIFAHNMDKKNYYKNLVLCESCHNKAITAGIFLDNELRTRIAGYDTYIIPHVIYGKNLSSSKIKQMAEIISPLTGTGSALSSVKEYRGEVERRLRVLNNEDYVFLLNILFYKKLQASTKIQKMIQDIDPSVFSDISNAFFDTLDIFEDHYSTALIDNLEKRANLDFIYYMHPVKLKDGRPSQYQNILKTYENILCKKVFRKEVVFLNLAQVLTAIWREKEGHNVSFDKNRTNRQKAFDFKILDCMYYVCFLKRYGVLKGGEGMDVKELNLNADITSYIREMNYNEQEASMFLLGVLIGAIGREQSKKQYEKEQEGTYKPILNKINFNGMDKYRIMKLSNQIPNKLRHEKIQQYYEAIFSAHKYLLDKNIQSWKLNKDESLFYLLSGYGYQTMKKKADKEVVSNG
jgi:CRISPR-associated protein Csh1